MTVGRLEGSLRWVGADDQLITLANRAAAEACLDNPRTAASLQDDLGGGVGPWR